MNKRFEHAFDKLEGRKMMLWKKLQTLDESKLGEQPDNKSWSIIQVLDHLVFSESASVNYSKKKLLAGDALKKPTFFHTQRMGFYNIILLSHFKIKAPAVVSAPSNTKSFAEAKADFENSRVQLKQFLEDFPEQYMDRAVYRHPLAGRITVLQMLKFFEAHFIHHTYQIDRTLRRLV
ncbi:MAG: DinB family protein [Cyclobacteriaceae bacterium]